MNYPEETETQRREREEAEDRAGESRMEQRRETMNEWELTDEELDAATEQSKYIIDAKRAIATAAQRKLWQMLFKGNPVHEVHAAVDADVLWYVEQAFNPFPAHQEAGKKATSRECPVKGCGLNFSGYCMEHRDIEACDSVIWQRGQPRPEATQEAGK